MILPFEPNSVRYSASNLATLLHAATIAYDTDRDRLTRTIKATLGSTEVRHFASDHTELLKYFPDFKIQDTQCYIAADTQKIILAFRGSEGADTGASFIKDWSSDAVIQQASFQKYFPSAPAIGSIHAGFGKALRDVWTKVSAHLAKMRLKYPEASLWITGHSLGGALAVLAATCCYYETQNQTPVAGCYTFGQPRVGDLIFRSFYESALGSRTYFVVNHGDLVTRIPPRSIDCMPSLNYATTGRLVFLSGGGATNDAIAWGRYTQTTIVGWKGIPDIPKSAIDHTTSEYRRSVTSAAGALATLAW